MATMATTYTARPTVSRQSLFSRIRQLPTTLIIGSLILIFYTLVALSAPAWVPYPYNKTGTDVPFASPSSTNLLGTDQLGRDVFSRVAMGTRVVMFIALTSTLIATIVGGTLGLLSGFTGGWFDEGIMRLVELFISIPLLVFALLVIAAAGPAMSGSIPLLIGVVALLYTPRIARMARAVSVDLTTRDFITVARARGESSWSIVLRELAPNASGPLLVEFGVRAAWAPLLVGTLGFLGVGVRPPTPEWGLMLAENRVAMTVAPVALLAPAVALAGLVIGINLFTDGLARVLGRQVQLGN
jgi:peptide/nickel transport system permease protein